MSPRRDLVTPLGRRGRPGYVRVFVEGELVRVLWTEAGKRRMESWPATGRGKADAKAFAEGTHERLTRAPASPDAPPAPLTLRELWDRYTAAEFDHLRPRSAALYRDAWRKWETFAGRNTPAHLVTPERLDEFKASMRALGIVPGQVRRVLALVKRVYRWAIVERRLLAPSLVIVSEYRYRVSRDERPAEIAEYTAEEAAAILAALSPRKGTEWRAWALTALIRYTGRRQNAALRLTWADVDLEAGVIRWPAATDKQGEAWESPLPEPARDALWVAYGYALAAKYDGPFVFFASRAHARAAGKPWGYSAYHAALHKAEARAKVERKPLRAAHGFRRGVANDVLAITGNPKTAAAFIGDQSLAVVERHYLRARAADMRDAAEKLGEGTANATGEDA